jgi:Protein of unknown function (DUF2946)
MDDIVKQALVKWPHVPHCYGWLGLDARGNWYMRDQQAQESGSFSSGQTGAKGSRLQHSKLIEFIQRNYACDTDGQWYFQNGPQRVYVELEHTPWVWRVNADGSVHAHDGQPTQCHVALVDEEGWLYLETPLGVGLVHTQDMDAALQAIEAGHWQLQTVQRNTLPERYHYVISPQQRQSGA